MTTQNPIESLEVANLEKHMHGDRVLCPCCGYPATLDIEGDKVNFNDSCWAIPDDHGNAQWSCVLMTLKWVTEFRVYLPSPVK